MSPPASARPVVPPVVRPITVASRPSEVAPRTPRWWRDAVGAATWASVLVVLALWLLNGGVQGLRTEPLTGIGRLTGLIAADLLLIQVVLMARVPMIERAYGQDELVRRHRLVGFTSFNLMVAHIVLIILGYAAGTDVGIVGTAVDLVLNYPGMLLALVNVSLLNQRTCFIQLRPDLVMDGLKKIETLHSLLFQPALQVLL